MIIGKKKVKVPTNKGTIIRAAAGEVGTAAGVGAVIAGGLPAAAIFATAGVGGAIVNGGILSDIKKRKRTKVNGITIEHRKTHVPL